VKNRKGSMAIICICTIGINAMGISALADSQSSQNTEQENKSLTSVILSFFANDDKEKNVGPEALLLKKPAKENADQYITLSEPASSTALGQPRNILSVRKSAAVKPSIIFNMGSIFNMGGAGLSSAQPSGFTGLRATTTGQQIIFSYGKVSNDTLGGGQDQNALGISLGSQFLVEPSSIMSPLYAGSEFDRLNTRQIYNLSVDMDYAGFKLGASYSQEKMRHDSGLKGFDIGLGYAGRKWGADVKFGEYKRERDLFFATTEEFYDTIYALEIGAGYQLYANIRFTGRFTYYAYGQENDLDSLRNSQAFFLGTNVNF